MDTKKCVDCNRNLPLSEFTKQRRNPDGLCYYCKWCMKVRNELYHKTHKEQLKAYRVRNKERIKKDKKLYRGKNKEQIKRYSKLYREEHKEQRNEYDRNRCRTDLKVNLNHRIRVAIRLSLKNGKGGRSWQILVGYTIEELKTHLQKTMPKSYTWQDFLRGNLQIDHIIPISVFNFSNSKHIDFKRCWALKNLRLLPAEENLVKGNILDKPFQPSLNI